MSAGKKIRLASIVTVFVASTIMVIANTPRFKHWWLKAEAPAKTEENNGKDPAQEALLRELRGWLQPFDSTNSDYYLYGSLTAIDKTDSAHALVDMPYSVYKSGRLLHMRMGKTETVNTASHYLFVDHDAQKMLLSKARVLLNTSFLPTGDLYAFLQSEGYAFTKSMAENGTSTISMVNANHISNKEFSITYDSVTHFAKKIFIRQADISDPMNTDREKWIALIIKEWSDTPENDRFPGTQKFIHIRQDTAECTAAFKNYELIVR